MSKKLTIYEINDYICSLLNVSNFDDIALNGIQVEAKSTITDIAFAVDACVETINLAANTGCQALITHHGIFWGRPQAIVGSHGHRVTSLIKNDISLAAYHIPLDASEICGNNVEMCNALGLSDLQPFGKFKGNYVGFVGTIVSGLTIDDIYAKLGFDIKTMPYVYLDFGQKLMKKIAIVSGGAGDDLYSAVDIGADLFITGESSHPLYHFAKECNINALFCGHYFTETFGVKALSKCVKQHFPEVNIHYFDVPTGL